ncbi:MAG: hypothetical protein RR585_04875 [Coprobacillus sp.]
MKRLIALLVYTIVVVGGSYLFRDSPNLMSVLGIGFIVVGFCAIGLLMPSTGAANARGFGPAADINYIKAQSGEGTQGVTSFASIFSVIYLVVPFLISMYLFL